VLYNEGNFWMKLWDCPMVEWSDKQDPMRMTESEYLAFERQSEDKHEYIDGEVIAMVGASRAHNLISVNLLRIISTHLRGKDCELYPSDMRVKIAKKKYTYPDVTIVCGAAQFADDEFDNLLNPTVIIEVLSKSTEAYDRGKKFRSYRQLDSLQEYILVAQDSPRIERYFIQQDGIWSFIEVEGIESSIELTSIACKLPFAEVYERVSFATDEE
jgi:Uma2 family endonuclease